LWCRWRRSDSFPGGLRLPMDREGLCRLRCLLWLRLSPRTTRGKLAATSFFSPEGHCRPSPPCQPLRSRSPSPSPSPMLKPELEEAKLRIGIPAAEPRASPEGRSLQIGRSCDGKTFWLALPSSFPFRCFQMERPPPRRT